MARPPKPAFVGPIRHQKNEKGRTTGYYVTLVSGPVPVKLTYPGLFQANDARKALVNGGAHSISSEAAVQSIAHAIQAHLPSQEADEQPKKGDDEDHG